MRDGVSGALGRGMRGQFKVPDWSLLRGEGGGQRSQDPAGGRTGGNRQAPPADAPGASPPPPPASVWPRCVAVSQRHRHRHSAARRPPQLLPTACIRVPAGTRYDNDPGGAHLGRCLLPRAPPRRAFQRPNSAARPAVQPQFLTGGRLSACLRRRAQPPRGPVPGLNRLMAGDGEDGGGGRP